MSLEQANRYYELAAKARQNGRNAIADALLRQAEREKEKAAMDVADVANIQRERANAQQNVAQPQQPVVETPATDVPIAQPNNDVPWSQSPSNSATAVNNNQMETNNQGLSFPDNKYMSKDNYVPYKYEPTAEELTNMEDSEQYNIRNNSHEGDLGLDLGVNDAQTYNQTGNDVIKAAPNSNPITDSVRNALIDSWGETQRDVTSDGSGFGGSFADKIDTAKKDVEILKQLYPEYYKIHMKDFAQ